MIVELVGEERLGCARSPPERQDTDRAERPSAPGAKQQRAAVGRDVTGPLVVRRHQQRLGRGGAIGGNPVQVRVADLAPRVDDVTAVRRPDRSAARLIEGEPRAAVPRDVVHPHVRIHQVRLVNLDRDTTAIGRKPRRRVALRLARQHPRAAGSIDHHELAQHRRCGHVRERAVQGHSHPRGAPRSDHDAIRHGHRRPRDREARWVERQRQQRAAARGQDHMARGYVPWVAAQLREARELAGRERERPQPVDPLGSDLEQQRLGVRQVVGEQVRFAAARVGLEQQPRLASRRGHRHQSLVGAKHDGVALSPRRPQDQPEHVGDRDRGASSPSPSQRKLVELATREVRHPPSVRREERTAGVLRAGQGHGLELVEFAAEQLVTGGGGADVDDPRAVRGQRHGGARRELRQRRARRQRQREASHRSEPWRGSRPQRDPERETDREPGDRPGRDVPRGEPIDTPRRRRRARPRERLGELRCRLEPVRPHLGQRFQDRGLDVRWDRVP